MGKLSEEIIKRDVVRVEKGFLHAYGWTWEKKNAPTLLRMNLKAFRDGRTPKEGGLGKLGHYINCVDLLWNEDHSRIKIEWHPWAQEFAKAACENSVLAVGGCASSGKTFSAAAWSLVNWLCDPFETMVLVTSTSLKDSKKRVWGDITNMFNAIPGLPGKLVPSMGLIRTTDPSGKREASDKCGLALIAGEKKREKEAVGKLIGFKAQRVFVVADELPELSEALIDAYFGNITKNPVSGLVGLGNPSTFFDAFGRLSEPKEGWDSVSENDHEWETKSGKFIRFDGFRSPNLDAGYDKYPYLFRQKNLDDDVARYGENSAIVWRMDRGYFSPIGNEDCIYSSGDIVKYKAMRGMKGQWSEPPTIVAALDPSFTTGGDRTMLVIGEYGKSIDGMKTLCYKKFILITEDAGNKDEPRNFQIARQVVAHLRKEQVSISHFAMDTTGAGDVLADIIVTMMGKGFHRVTFSGAASELPLSNFDATPANEKYTNRVTEIWFSGRDLIQTGQLKGITTEMAAEMVARRYTVAKGSSARVTAETKPDMKARTGSSPDCFVAGTKVMTETGERPIEEIKIGDKVLTPFGLSPVVATHMRRGDSTCVSFSNGRNLEGLGKHRVFVWGQGWRRMDELSVGMKAESVHTYPIWVFLQKLFTRAESSDFKAMVDTTKATAMMTRKDFFIAGFGQIILGLSRKGTASTTRTESGGTMIWETWKSCESLITQGCTLLKGGIRCLMRRRRLGGQQGLPQPPNGTSPPKGLLGTVGMESNPLQKSLLKELNWSAHVVRPSFSAGKNNPKNFAPTSAGSEQTSGGLSGLPRSVWSAAKTLRHAIKEPELVVVDVLAPCSESKEVLMYNLTLERENTYYANGVLVENCADAGFILLSLCREKLGMVSTAKAAKAAGAQKSWKNLAARYSMTAQAGRSLVRG